MNCPVCSVPLIVVERHGIELDYCVECKGLWFDAGELRLLGEALKLDIEVPDIDSLPEVDAPEKYRRCPRCEKRMEKTSLEDISRKDS